MVRLLWLGTALFCGIVGAINCAPGQELGEPYVPPRLSARGLVVDPDGRPVAGARVVLREWPSIRRSDDPYQRDVRDILSETNTDADGRFRFADVASRPFKSFRERMPWDVVASADGFAPAWVHVAKADDERELTLRLSDAKTINGRLVDPDGTPIAECKVQVAFVGAPGSQWHTDLSDPELLDWWSCELTPRTTTDKDGRFKLAALPADRRLTLLAEHPDFSRGHIYVATTSGPQAPVEQPSVSPDGKQEVLQQTVHMSGFTETLERGRRVRGRVVLADTDQPLPGAKVNASWQNRVHYAVADEEGRFELTGIVDPKLNVFSWTDEPGYLAARKTVTFSEGVRQQELELRLPLGEKVSGRVIDDQTGGGVAGVRVTYVVDGADGESWSPTQSPTTDEKGAFAIFVPTGAGELRVSAVNNRHSTHDVPDFWRWRSKQSLAPHHSAKIDVVAGKPTDPVELKVGRGLVIRGTVVDDRGRPVFAAEVRATDRYQREELAKKTVTDDQGRFELAGFPPHEEQRIDVSDATSQMVGYALVPADEKAEATRVVDLPPIELRGTGRVVGQVLGDGKPLAGVTVTLQRETEPPKLEGLEARAGRSWWTTAQKAMSDGDGRFEFELVDAGTQFMVSVYPDGYTDANSRVQKLKAGETVEMPALELKSRAAFVAGIVVDPDGKPVPGVTVSASIRGGGSISYGRRGPPPETGPDGRFRLVDLPNVPLQLLAYIRAPAGTKDLRIHFPAYVNAEPNQTDVRIVLDPKLQRPLP